MMNTMEMLSTLPIEKYAEVSTYLKQEKEGNCIKCSDPYDGAPVKFYINTAANKWCSADLTAYGNLFDFVAYDNRVKLNTLPVNQRCGHIESTIYMMLNTFDDLKESLGKNLYASTFAKSLSQEDFQWYNPSRNYMVNESAEFSNLSLKGFLFNDWAIVNLGVKDGETVLAGFNKIPSLYINDENQTWRDPKNNTGGTLMDYLRLRTWEAYGDRQDFSANKFDYMRDFVHLVVEHYLFDTRNDPPEPGFGLFKGERCNSNLENRQSHVEDLARTADKPKPKRGLRL